MTATIPLSRRAALASGVGALVAPALAQPAWPMARPIEVIVGFAPGGGTDVMVRALMQMMSAELPGANFVIANRPGAGGETAYVATQGARPDGYTIGTINTRRATSRSASNGACATTARASGPSPAW